MDRKALIVIVVSFLLLLLWYPLMNRLYPPPPVEPRPPVTERVPDGPDAPRIPAPSPDAPPRTVLVDPEAPEELVQVENERAIFTFTSHGGGLKLVELKDHWETVVCRVDRAVPARYASLNTRAPIPALSLLGGGALQENGVYQVRREGQHRVIAEKLLENGLSIVKDFRIGRARIAGFEIGTNYLLTAEVRLENRSGQPIALPEQQWVTGTATPLGLRDETQVMGVFWYDGNRSDHVRPGWFQDSFFRRARGVEYTGGNHDVAWTAVHNQFFTLAVVPEVPAPRVSIRRVDLPPPSEEVIAANSGVMVRPYGLQTALVYPGTVLGPNESISRNYTIFAGPKEYNTLARIGKHMENELDRVMEFGGFFGFFSQFLLISMNGLHGLFGFGYGLAIICITIVIKLLFWPLTNASTRSMKRMAALQPQMKALQEKYKEDPKKMNQKLMEFMRENKVNPLGSCLPLLLQLPIFIGFFKMLRSAVELRGESFLWVCDLSQADTIFVIPGLNFPVNPLPIIMGVTMLFQARLTPVAPTMDPLQQKILKYMPLMFIVILYSMSAGLVLYWTINNVLTILQMKVTKVHEPAAPASATPGKTATAPGKPSQPGPTLRHKPKKKKK
jgi:YidC/Oxa1 family membrane protein insertase